MSRFSCIIILGFTFTFAGWQACSAQYGGASQLRVVPVPVDQLRGAVRTLLLQVDHLVEDMEMDLQRDPISERLLLTANEVQDETEQLAATVERIGDLNHAVREFQEFDAAWHRLTRQVSRYASDDRHLQRNLARVSQTDTELHRLLHVPAPVNVQELHAVTSALQRTVHHLREDLETDLRGTRHERLLVAQVAVLEETTEHFESSIVHGADLLHLRQDFDAIDNAWLQLAGSLRELSSMRFDHVQRAAANVATVEAQLRSALGVEPNPEQFTCFRAAPSEVRRNLPYPATDWSLALGLLFGGDSREPRNDRSPPRRSEEDEHDHDHFKSQISDSRSQPPPIRRVGTSNPPTAPANVPELAAPVPPKPTESPLSPLQAKVDKNLARLSPESRAAALAQRTCPVSGELLGSHGTPIKVRLKGKDESGKRREVFVCCDECEDKLDDHPERYLDRLGDRD
jgi:hypothetical protein